ncbi:GUN4 domain-containing protein [Phormidesmis sp. 146-33]
MTNEPQHDDAVLGGSQVPTGALILGGFEGLRRRLKNPIATHRSAALIESLQYGERGLNLVIRALNDRSEEVRQSAYLLLKDRSEPRVLKAIQQYYVSLNYEYLRSLLAAKRWQEADQETKVAMFKACGLRLTDLSEIPARGRLTSERIAIDFPCQDLQILDQLWMDYSGDRFGFSVQSAFWQKIDATFWDKSEVWSRFGDRVGWRVNRLIDHHWKRYDQLTFNLEAPRGHLPYLGDEFGIFTIEAIATRIRSCTLEN